MSHVELERELRALDREIEWPATPDVAAAIGLRLAPRDDARRRLVPRLRLAIAGVLLLAFAVAALADTPVRAAIERVLGIAGGERVERVERVPAADRRLDLGPAVTLAQARAAVGVPVLLPRALGPPDGVRLGGDRAAASVSLLYGTDTVLTQTPAASAVIVVKQVGAGVAVVPVTIGDAQGYWIERGPRALMLLARDGAPVRVRAALPGAGVLLWDRGGSAFRLETRRPLSVALEIARSIR